MASTRLQPIASRPYGMQSPASSSSGTWYARVMKVPVVSAKMDHAASSFSKGLRTTKARPTPVASSSMWFMPANVRRLSSGRDDTRTAGTPSSGSDRAVAATIAAWPQMSVPGCTTWIASVTYSTRPRVRCSLRGRARFTTPRSRNAATSATVCAVLRHGLMSTAPPLRQPRRHARSPLSRVTIVFVKMTSWVWWTQVRISSRFVGWLLLTPPYLLRRFFCCSAANRVRRLLVRATVGRRGLAGSATAGSSAPAGTRPDARAALWLTCAGTGASSSAWTRRLSRRAPSRRPSSEGTTLAMLLKLARCSWVACKQ